MDEVRSRTQRISADWLFLHRYGPSTQACSHLNIGTALRSWPASDQAMLTSLQVDALAELAGLLHRVGYRFPAVTPESHGRVLKRRGDESRRRFVPCSVGICLSTLGRWTRRAGVCWWRPMRSNRTGLLVATEAAYDSRRWAACLICTRPIPPEKRDTYRFVQSIEAEAEVEVEVVVETGRH